MQTVLSIDASTSPAEALVVGIQGDELSIIEQHFCPLSDDGAFMSNFKDLISSVETTCTNAIIFLPGNSHISLNLSLPFGEGKQLSKIIDLEVQDVVPFELDDFLLHHRHVGRHGQSGEDVHVALYPKSKLTALLEVSRGSDFEPVIISTPGSALQGLYEMHGESLGANAAIILEHKHVVYLSIIIGSKIVSDRSLPRDSYPTGGHNLMNADIEIAIRSAEERYGTKLSMVYHISDDTAPTVQCAANRTVKALSVSTLFPSIRKKVSPVALLGALFAQDFPAPQILSNFRTRDFAYTPRLGELFRGLKELAPYIVTLLLICSLGLLTMYYIRGHHLSEIRTAMVNEITKEIPDFTADEGSEADTLQKKATALQDVLKDLGSPLASSPLDILSLISEDLKSVEGITTTRVTVKNGEVRVDGTAPNYKTIERLETTFKRRKATFCKVKNDSPASGSRDNTRDFQITLGLCD